MATLTKLWKINNSIYEIEMMSNGTTLLWKGDESVIGIFSATKEDQEELVKQIKELVPGWKEGDITRRQ